MKTDETVVFDYLKPDFSILKDRRVVMVNIQPEYQFYFKHRIIHWLNQLNEHCEPDVNFENITFNRYMVGHTGTVTAVYGIGNRAGNIYFNYDHNTDYKEFVNVSFSVHEGLYKNNKKFPNTSHLFNASFTADKNYEMVQYEIERSIDMTDRSIDDFLFYYKYKNDGTKLSTRLIMYDFVNSEELIIKDDECMNSDNGFDDFFNNIIVTILKSFPTFLELYPQLDVSQINDNTSFEKFSENMKKLYADGIFDVGLEDNLSLIRMMTI